MLGMYLDCIKVNENEKLGGGKCSYGKRMEM